MNRRSARGLAPTSDESVLRSWAYTFLRRREFQRAHDIVTEMIRRHNDDDDSQGNIGDEDAHNSINRRVYREPLELQNKPLCHLLRSRASLCLQQPSSALRDALQALEALEAGSASHARALSMAADAMMALDNLEHAIKMYYRGLRLDAAGAMLKERFKKRIQLASLSILNVFPSQQKGGKTRKRADSTKKALFSDPWQGLAAMLYAQAKNDEQTPKNDEVDLKL